MNECVISHYSLYAINKIKLSNVIRAERAPSISTANKQNPQKRGKR